MHLNTLSTKDIYEVIANYCKEKEKEESLTQTMATYIILMNVWQNPSSIALDYFLNKFDIYTITDAKGKVITIF